MNLEECRKEIDAIDNELVELFVRRMNVAKDIAICKKESGKAVYDSERERLLLEKVEECAGEEFADYTKRLYSSILELSRNYQSNFLAQTSVQSVCEKESKA